jgi:ABC-2 type transport system permease protein
MIKELKRIFSDSYVAIIFLLGGLIYPLVYGIVYNRGTVDDMPLAIVDMSGSAESRRFARKLDATREVEVAYKCATMQEAQALMQERKVHGIVLFPEDYSERLANLEQATVSTYADMASFLYYKDITMAVNHVMLDEMGQIEATRYAATGMSEESIKQLINAIPAEEEIPFNTNMSFLIFFLSAALILVVQQTMFYGVSVMNGSMREGGATHDGTLLGRASAYALIYIGIAVYGLLLVPMMFGMPQRGALGDMLVLIFLFIITCVAFSFTFSRFIHHRETVFVVLLFMSSLCLFLSGCAWPVSSFPPFWKAFSYLFPSTFMIQGFNNVNNAACTLSMIRPQILGLCAQFAFYSITAFIMDMSERNHYRTLVDRIEEKFVNTFNIN